MTQTPLTSKLSLIIIKIEKMKMHFHCQMPKAKAFKEVREVRMRVEKLKITVPQTEQIIS